VRKRGGSSPDFAQVPAIGRNHLRLLFTHPAVHFLHAEWEHDGTAVAAVRMEAATDPDDPELAVLGGELAVQDPDFRTWWATHQVVGAHYGTKHTGTPSSATSPSTAAPGTAPTAPGGDS
jgi:MmyB-like transcription regulator ligand binding domain